MPNFILVTGVEHMFPGPYYAYYTSSSAEQVQYAYDRVLDFVKTNGPFGGVIGFSQGGALAATALLHHAKLYPAADPLFKLGIFLCATLPFLPPGTDESDNSNKDLDNYDPQNGDRRVMIPTVHIIGRKDQYVGMCESLAELCSVNGNANGDMTIVHHDQGHLVSRDPEFVRKAAAVIDDKLKAIESS